MRKSFPMEVERPAVWPTTEQREYEAEQRARTLDSRADNLDKIVAEIAKLEPSKANALRYLEIVTKADAYREVAEDLRRPRRNRIYDEATAKYYAERRT